MMVSPKRLLPHLSKAELSLDLKHSAQPEANMPSNSVLKDNGRLIINALPEEHSDPDLPLLQARSAWNSLDPRRLVRLAIPESHPAIETYISVRSRITEALASVADQPYLFTPLEVVWRDTTSRLQYWCFNRPHKGG